jgi:hypothetical protein
VVLPSKYITFLNTSKRETKEREKERNLREVF